MCSVIKLVPGYTLPYEYLFNAVHNNEHGYGVLLKENKRIHVKKELPQKVDPESLYKYLKDNEDVERWVHLRNISAGALHLDNVQPIQVYQSNKRQVWFVHNGTITYQTIGDKFKKSLTVDIDDKIHSDSFRYAHQKVAPLLLRLKGENGMGDIQDPLVQELLEKSWQYGFGRAALISSDQDEFLLNSNHWVLIEDTVDPNIKFLASNDD